MLPLRRLVFARHIVVLLGLLVLVAACGGARDATIPAAVGANDDHPADHDGSHDDHASDHDAHRGHDPGHDGSASTATRQPMTTEETLAAMAAMDPARLAALHAAHHAPDRGTPRARVHPNGIDPHRLVVPAIGVDAEVIRLGTNPDGTMEVPADFAQTGWFEAGPRPGRVGPAVIAGHVDSRAGPAVFFRLAELRPGDEIEVHDAHGEVVAFVVREVERVPKDAFPTERVYAGTAGPELRLVTCGGRFDRGSGHYDDNIIVYAHRVDP